MATTDANTDVSVQRARLYEFLGKCTPSLADAEARTISHVPAKTVEDWVQGLSGVAGVEMFDPANPVPTAWKLCKNLFVRDKIDQKLFLIVALADTPVPLTKVTAYLGLPKKNPLRFAPEEDLYSVLGVRPGNVTPFACFNDATNKVSVLLDSRMEVGAPTDDAPKEAQGRLIFHPLTNDLSTPVTNTELYHFMVRVCFLKNPVHLSYG